MSRCMVVIPARLASTRLPRKMLLADTGKPLIQHTYEAASLCERIDEVWVATDHQEIVTAVEQFGGRVCLTSPDAQSGTDRLAEIARQRPDVEIFVNVQGDEPEISAEAITKVIELLSQDRHAVMSTVATPIRNRSTLEDPACVKVVFDGQGRAQYFSRSVIPYPRGDLMVALQSDPPLYFAHVGLYAYRRDFLLQFPELPPSPKERMESLEQLRVLDAGEVIRVGVVAEAAAGIDTLDDYRAFVTRQQSC